MYSLIRVNDVIRIPPAKFGRPVKDVALEELRSKYEGTIASIESKGGEHKLGIIVTIIDVKVDENGRILPGDGATYHDVEMSALVFSPFIKEVVEGEAVTVAKSGIYLNLGVLDGFIHINQVSEEKVSYDNTRSAIMLEESHRTIEKGDILRAKIYTIGILPGKGLRIHMTMKQPYLGKLEWVSKQGGQGE
ncbi:DNA-directed RNA polymerase [Desulfurococcus amylolyticus]|uniref:DNA-directed RNA polymerase subunit Rpo7 n=1 Tax=Desulfurococcus amylolyticus (strain DSM 18924 / JCM 16383 / VKM B-2413 / 1221n) TaxID=490899 RepID=B8D6E0_DESA1|nr:DNA-directed RNA polymerase [Desulfurococcus amylolyticus]ACL11671.1 DNA-directed RNA polymerase subunit E' [Desulfurococcus amylolyticus 1221n]